jgi:HAD superfamily hydrolase (TIGR01509 family)
MVTRQRKDLVKSERFASRARLRYRVGATVSRPRSLTMQPDLIIFDCDGVLVDSEIIAARVEADMISEAGFPISHEEMVERFAGLTTRDILLRLETVSQVPFQASLIDRIKAELDKRLARDVRPVDGAAAAVRATNIPYCICSNSPLDRIEAMLGRAGMSGLFDRQRIFSAREIPSMRTKPAPDIFLHGAAQLSVEPAKCFVVEDSVHGVTGARAAGMRVIGFTGASHSWPGHADALTEAGAETVISRWPDFAAVVAALSEWSADS